MPLSHWLPGQTRRSRASCLHRLLWVLFAVGLWGCGTEAPTFAAQSAAPPAPPVVVAEVTPRPVPIYEEFVARTQAMHTVELRARVEGFLEQVLFREGSLVQKGQLLFVVEPRPYEAALLSAKARLAQAQADLTRAQEHVEVLRARAQLAQQRAALAKARQDVARLRPLVRDRAVPQQDLDTALAAEQAVAIDRTLDPQTGTITVQARFPNPDKLTRPEQFGRVRIMVRELTDALLVLQLAVQELQGTQTVLVVDRENTVTLRTISLGDRYQNFYVVLKGLAPSEHVVVEGQQQVCPGMQVTPTLRPAAAEQSPGQKGGD